MADNFKIQGIGSPAEVYQRMQGDRPNPVRGQFYRHWKGGTVEVLGTTSPPITLLPLAPTGRLRPVKFALHSETSEEMAVFDFGDRISLATLPKLTFVEEPFVVYLHRGRFWARPLPNFMARLGDEDAGYFRLELIQQEG